MCEDESGWGDMGLILKQFVDYRSELVWKTGMAQDSGDVTTTNHYEPEVGKRYEIVTVEDGGYKKITIIVRSLNHFNGG